MVPVGSEDFSVVLVVVGVVRGLGVFVAGTIGLGAGLLGAALSEVLPPEGS